MTEYLVPYANAESEFEEKRSRFISHVFLVETEAEARARIEEMKKKYYVFECPGCKQQVRIPNRGKKGRVAIVCPACKTRFVRMRW